MNPRIITDSEFAAIEDANRVINPTDERYHGILNRFYQQNKGVLAFSSKDKNGEETIHLYECNDPEQPSEKKLIPFRITNKITSHRRDKDKSQRVYEIIGNDAADCIGSGIQGPFDRSIATQTPTDGERPIQKIRSEDNERGIKSERLPHDFDLASVLQNHLLAPPGTHMKQPIVMDGVRYTTMRLHQGSDVFDFIEAIYKNKIPRLDIFEFISFCLNICRAVKAQLHDRDVIHRDLKLENIIINPHTGKIHIIDTDTGKFVDEDDEGKIIGTPIYISPEVILGGGTTEKSDIFSLGYTLFYFLLSNEFLSEKFQGDLDESEAIIKGMVTYFRNPSAYPQCDLKDMSSQFALFFKKRQEQIQIALDPSLDESLTQLIKRMCDPHPDTRPSLDEIIATFQEIKVELRKEYTSQDEVKQQHIEKAIAVANQFKSQKFTSTEQLEDVIKESLNEINDDPYTVDAFTETLGAPPLLGLRRQKDILNKTQEIIHRFEKNKAELYIMLKAFEQFSLILSDQYLDEKKYILTLIKTMRAELGYSANISSIHTLAILGNKYKEIIQQGYLIINSLEKSKHSFIQKHSALLHNELFVKTKKIKDVKNIRLELAILQLELMKIRIYINEKETRAQITEIIKFIHSTLQKFSEKTPANQESTALLRALNKVNDDINKIADADYSFEVHIELARDKYIDPKELLRKYIKYEVIFKENSLEKQHQSLIKFLLLKYKRRTLERIKHELEQKKRALNGLKKLFKLRKERKKNIPLECKQDDNAKKSAEAACLKAIKHYPLIKKANNFIDEAKNSIKSYQDRPRDIKSYLNGRSHLHFFSVCVDNDRGLRRAKFYEAALNNKEYSSNQKVLILYALLASEDGKQLQRDVIKALGFRPKENNQATEEMNNLLLSLHSLSNDKDKNQLIKELNSKVGQIVHIANSSPKNPTDLRQLDAILNEQRLTLRR